MQHDRTSERNKFHNLSVTLRFSKKFQKSCHLPPPFLHYLVKPPYGEI